MNRLFRMFRPSIKTFSTIPCPKPDNRCSLIQCPFVHQSAAAASASSGETCKRPLSTNTATSPPPLKKPRSNSPNKDTAVLIPRSFTTGYAPSPLHQRLTYVTELFKAYEAQGVSLPKKAAIEKEFEVASKSSKFVYDSSMKKYIRSVKTGAFRKEEEERRMKEINQKKDILNGLIDEEIYVKVKALIHDKTLLEKNGYVITIPEVKLPTGESSDPTTSRTCERCKSPFQQSSTEDPNTTKCTYHERKKYKTTDQLHWQCCDQIVGETQGCKVSPYHVFKASTAIGLNELIPFRQVPVLFSHSQKKNIIGLDCEMGYTTKGLELIRLTIVDFKTPQKTLLDEIVKPSGKTLDLNTQWSGVASIPSSSKTLKELQDHLFKTGLINSNTIIIGHGLENDLNALRLIYPQVVDTAILYPKGLQWKYSLKDLAMELLEMTIQTGEHSSEEDSIAAVEVVKCYLNGAKINNR